MYTSRVGVVLFSLNLILLRNLDWNLCTAGWTNSCSESWMSRQKCIASVSSTLRINKRIKSYRPQKKQCYWILK